MCGADVMPPLRFGESNPNTATAAAAYIRECIANGDFDEFTPSKWVDSE